MYNQYLESYFYQYMGISDNKKKTKLDNKYDPINLFLQAYKYGNRFGNEESPDTTRKSGKEKSTDTTRKKD